MRGLRTAVITMQLRALEPVTIGDPLHADVVARVTSDRTDSDRPEVSVDIPVAQDPFHEPCVRGTSVLGSLRSHLAAYRLIGGRDLELATIDSRGRGAIRSRPATLADLLCGSEPEEYAQRENPDLKPQRALAPSALRVVSVSRTSGTVNNGRPRTAINRFRAAAEPRRLFRRANVIDLAVDVVLQVDLWVLEDRWRTLVGDGSGPSASAVIQDLVSAILAWKPSLGGMRTSGRGLAKLRHVRWGIADPLTLDALTRAKSTIELYSSVAISAATEQPLWVVEAPIDSGGWEWQVELTAADPLLVSPSPVIGADGRPTNESRTADHVSGTSWKGLLRSRCEFVLRSCGVHACESSTQTDGTCPTCVLFGSASDDENGRMGLVRFGDSTIDGVRISIDHAPIDRFTGGAADEKLFTHEAWQPGARMRLTISQAHPQRPVPDWGKHLLTFALRDLGDGLVGLGASTTRGYGTVSVSSPLPDVPSGWLDGVPMMPTAPEVTG